MLSYIIVGSGYRAEYYGRIAKTWPELFRAVFLCRSAEKAALMKERTGVDATTDAAEAAGFRPDFAVIAVDRGHMAQTAEEWIRKGLPVVTETPVGETDEQLTRLWKLGREGAKIVCCEQYHRQPLLAGGLRILSEGRIGTPSSMYISLLHDYHAASLIRRAMQIPVGEPYTIYGAGQRNRAAETDSRGGAILDGREADVSRTQAIVAYESGKQVLYDFCPIQYRSYIRARHLTVRGSTGEWSDTVIRYLDGANRPEQIFLMPEIPERYRPLDTQALRDRRRNWQSDLAPDTVQDEYAIATILADMADYLRGGSSPYPLADALEDARFWILLQEAVRRPYEEIRSRIMPWH